MQKEVLWKHDSFCSAEGVFEKKTSGFTEFHLLPLQKWKCHVEMFLAPRRYPAFLILSIQTMGQLANRMLSS